MRLIRMVEVVGQEVRAGEVGGRSGPVLRTVMAATVMAMSLGAGVARAEDVSQVKGALLFAGGELRFDNAPVWKQFVDLAGGEGASVVVMPTAAEHPRKSGQATVDNLVKCY